MPQNPPQGTNQTGTKAAVQMDTATATGVSRDPRQALAAVAWVVPVVLLLVFAAVSRSLRR